MRTVLCEVEKRISMFITTWRYNSYTVQEQSVLFYERRWCIERVTVV
jgi:hypothetical protein